MIEVVSGLRTETASGRQVFKTVAVVAGRLALPQCEDIGKANRHRHKRGDEGHGEGLVKHDQQDKEHDDARTDAADEPPKEVAFQSPRPALGIGCRVGIGQSQFAFGIHGRVKLGQGSAWSAWSIKSADADGAAGVEAEDFVEGIDHRRGRRDDQSAEDGHFALVHVAAPDGEAAIDDREDAQDEPEQHDDGQAVTDDGLQGGGTEGGALGEGGNGVECEQGRHGEERTQPRTDFRSVYFFHIIGCAGIHFYFCWRHTPPITRKVLATPQTRFV